MSPCPIANTWKSHTIQGSGEFPVGFDMCSHNRYRTTTTTTHGCSSSCSISVVHIRTCWAYTCYISKTTRATPLITVKRALGSSSIREFVLARGLASHIDSYVMQLQGLCMFHSPWTLAVQFLKCLQFKIYIMINEKISYIWLTMMELWICKWIPVFAERICIKYWVELAILF